MMVAVVHQPAVTQQALAAALLDPARDVPNGLRVRAGIDPRRRFAVHRNNAIASLVDALAAAFPVTQALVGKDFFRAMACERVRVDPPCSPILVDYGDGFAGFIAGFAPAQGVPYLADISRLEQFRVQAYHAADAVPVDVAAYHALVATPTRLSATRVRLHPACRWLRSEYAVRSIWNAHQDIDASRDVDLGAIAIDAPEDTLVTRPQWDVQVTALPERGIAWLDALRDGMTLGAASAQAGGGDDTPLESSLKSLLSLIVRHGLVVTLDLPPE